MLKNHIQARVIEIFYSLSGEGITAGIPTVFIRLAGCSLRCGRNAKMPLWCDTPYGLSYTKGKLMTVAEVLEAIASFTSSPVQILVTGGEPLETETGKREFTQAIADRIHKLYPDSEFAAVRIETNGREPVKGLRYMVYSMDYKLPGSGMEKFMNQDNFKYLAKRKNPLDEVKFVIRNRGDFDHSLFVIKQFHLENCNLVYSPVHGELQPADLADWIKNAGLPKSRLSLQLHKILWGNIKGV